MLLIACFYHFCPAHFNLGYEIACHPELVHGVQLQQLLQFKAEGAVTLPGQDSRAGAAAC